MSTVLTSKVVHGHTPLAPCSSPVSFTQALTTFPRAALTNNAHRLTRLLDHRSTHSLARNSHTDSLTHTRTGPLHNPAQTLCSQFLMYTQALHAVDARVSGCVHAVDARVSGSDRTISDQMCTPFGLRARGWAYQPRPHRRLVRASALGLRRDRYHEAQRTALPLPLPLPTHSSGWRSSPLFFEFHARSRSDQPRTHTCGRRPLSTLALPAPRG